MKKISPKKLSKKHITAVVLISLAILTSSICIFRHLNQNADEEFSEYTHNLFCQEVSGSTITLHYTLKDPSSYGIENVPVTYGRCTTDTRAICAAVENEQAHLHSHKRSQLSKENQLT